ncbi:MAG: hypothetical protein IT548_07035 [Alphaproteobacteria bacterium]|nr:hypothetical protein [Alphaproteobacteria bacterium]
MRRLGMALVLAAAPHAAAADKLSQPSIAYYPGPYQGDRGGDGLRYERHDEEARESLRIHNCEFWAAKRYLPPGRPAELLRQLRKAREPIDLGSAGLERTVAGIRGLVGAHVVEPGAYVPSGFVCGERENLVTLLSVEFITHPDGSKGEGVGVVQMEWQGGRWVSLYARGFEIQDGRKGLTAVPDDGSSPPPPKPTISSTGYYPHFVPLGPGGDSLHIEIGADGATTFQLHGCAFRVADEEALEPLLPPDELQLLDYFRGKDLGRTIPHFSLSRDIVSIVGLYDPHIVEPNAPTSQGFACSQADGRLTFATWEELHWADGRSGRGVQVTQMSQAAGGTVFYARGFLLAD